MQGKRDETRGAREQERERERGAEHERQEGQEGRGDEMSRPSVVPSRL